MYTNVRTVGTGQTVETQKFTPSAWPGTFTTQDCGTFSIQETTEYKLGDTVEVGRPRTPGRTGTLFKASEATVTNPYSRLTYSGSLLDPMALLQAYVDGTNANPGDESGCAPLSAGGIYIGGTINGEADFYVLEGGQEFHVRGSTTHDPNQALGQNLTAGALQVDRVITCHPRSYDVGVYVKLLEIIEPIPAISEIAATITTVYSRACASPRSIVGGICVLQPGSIDPMKNLGKTCSQVGNPCHAGTGNKFQTEVDYVGKGRDPLLFIRYYNSGELENLHLGSKWRTNFDRAVRLVTAGGATTVTVQRPDGKQYVFSWNGTAWVADADLAITLTGTPDGVVGFNFRDESIDEIEQYDATGKLIHIQKSGLSTVTLSYMCPKVICRLADEFLLTTITSYSGRTITLEYDIGLRIKKMIDPGRGEFLYTYSSISNDANLTSVTYPDGTTKKYLYGETEHVAQDSLVDVSHALTGIIDENEDRFATWKYDSQGRVVSSEHANGVEKVSLTFGAALQTTVVNPDAPAIDLQFTVVHGVVKETSRSLPKGAGSPASTRQTTYDERGNIATLTDPNGTITKFTYDSYDQETSRTEAFGTALARTTTTTWSEFVGLPATVSRAGLTRQYTYDMYGDVLRIEETAGALVRTWNFTYTSRNLVTSSEPGAGITVRTYGSNSNLATVSNALNQTTVYSSYDLHGNPTEIRDPNGLVTVLIYDPRQRITSSTVGNRTTSYEYDAVGQLIKTTQPSGAFVRFRYDAAHRLIGMSDAAGNTVDYTLDNFGNRVLEQVKDVEGNLTSLITRTFDELNRLKSIKRGQ